MTIDVHCDNRNKKCPDASYKIRRPDIPAPPPAWLKFLPNGQPYPNLVVEVDVNNESPTSLLEDMQRYFRRETSC
jgi:Uma2 family endonuclease